MNYFNHDRYRNRHEIRLQKQRYYKVVQHINRKEKLKRINEINNIFIICDRKNKNSIRVPLNIASYIRYM